MTDRSDILRTKVRTGTRPVLTLERVSGIEPPSQAWKACILAIVLHPQLVLLLDPSTIL